mgnify:CR=1 FL=1
MSAVLTPTFNTVEFSSVVGLLLQQKGSKLRPGMMTGSHTGKQASPLNQLGAVEATEVTSRFGVMGRTDATPDRRWVFPRSFDVPQLIDPVDLLKMNFDPSSQYVTNALYALGRKIDDEILRAMFTTTSKTGEQGGTDTTFLSTNVVGLNTGGANSSLNIPKLRAAKRLLMLNEVDLDNDPVYCAITADEHDALLNEVQVISSDFNGREKPVLEDGKVVRFLGVNFVHCERIITSALALDDQSTSASSKQIPMWAQSAMYLGMWNELESSLERRADLQSRPWQLYSIGTWGATRLEEKKIVKIWSAARA